jgi:hypothetical protein
MPVSTRRRAVRAIAPVAGLLAAGLLVWQGSYAAFSATSSNTANAWTTGTLNLTNNGGTASPGTYGGSTTGVFAQTGIKIGDTGAKCITVNSNAAVNPADTNTLSLYRGALTTGTVGSETNAQRDALAAQVALTVTAINLNSTSGNVDAACTGFPSSGTSSVYSGTLSAMPTAFGAGTSVTVPSGAQRIAYKFAWTLTTTGLPASDNALQGLSVGADLMWELQ